MAAVGTHLENVRPEPSEPHPRRWTREDYYRLAEQGWFCGRRVERIGGEILETSPRLSRHSTSVLLVENALREAFGPGHCVRTQMPLEFIDSDPEPDAAVVPGNPRSWAAKHPATAVLVVEVSDTTLAFDRSDKASLYARAGIADYWIVNLIDRCVEVHREPAADPKARFGHTYRSRQIIGPDGSIEPAAAPGHSVAAADLLP